MALFSVIAFLPISKENTAFVGNNINIQSAMSFIERNYDTIGGIDSDNPFSIPFMNASEQGLSAGNIINLDEGILTLGLFDGKTKDYAFEWNIKRVCFLSNRKIMFSPEK